MGRSPCCTQEGLKKGPWTQDEDEILIAFVKEHGHGNWRALPKKCGLLRCGKSCRLRWNNYLRPDIKRGLFTLSEEQKIIQLHALVGNKWAFIASQLPKRTDNEIKNYWNTVLKKRLEKLGLRTSLVSFSTDRALISADAERQRPQDMSKGNMQRQDNQNNKSSSNASKKPSCNNSLSVMSCTHLAQWESARLEAEARLRRASQSSKTHKPFPFAHMGHSFSSSTSTTSTAFASHIHTHHQSHLPHLPNHTHTHHQSQLPHLSNPKQTNHQSQLPQPSTCSIPTILPSSNSSPCLTHQPSTINPALSTASSLSLSAVVSMPSSCCSSTLNSLASQESIASSALTLASSGRLSWQAKELSFTTSPSNIGDASHSSLITQLLCQIEKDNGQEVDLQASLKEGTAELRGQEQLNMEARSCKVDLNSTMESSKDLNSTMQNWHDLIFEMENSCSDVVSSCWKGPQREEFTHDSLSFFSNTPKSGTLQCPHGTSLDLEGLNLLHFDNLLPCEPYIANQHSHVLNMKELLWDSPTTLSMSSTSIVN